ncbi:MAG: DUF1559 domain-containing protein [Isosphaeraceae bacterium]
MNRRTARRASGFTLIELLVVIAIIGVLVSLLLPAINACREAARRAQCVNNLLQLVVALQNYQSTHEVLPPGVVNPVGPIASTPLGYHHGWITQILPYLGLNNAFRRVDFGAGVYDRANSTIAALRIGVLLCPSDVYVTCANGAAGNTYAGNHHDVEAPIDVDNHGLLFLNSAIRYEDVSDGGSFTILIGEKLASSTELGWTSGTRASLRNTGSVIDENGVTVASPGVGGEKPEEPSSSSDSIDGDLIVGGHGSRHPGGANFAFADGSVRFLSKTISNRVIRLLSHRADGDLISADEY